MNPIPRFNLYRPRKISEALSLKDELRESKFIAGGTDILLDMKRGTCNTKNLIDLSLIKELRYIEKRGNHIHIGSTTTFDQIIHSEDIRKHAQALYEAASGIGSNQIRKLATIGGNLCNASPAADSAPPLLIYNAEVEIRDKEHSRVIPLAKLFTKSKKNCLKQSELVTEVKIPVLSHGEGASFLRIGRRKAFTLSVVNAAAYLQMNKAQVTCARLSFGSVAETPIRITKVEDIMKGKILTDELVDEASEMVKDAVSPITDIRGTADYRRDMCGVLIKRAIIKAADRARGE